MMLNSWVLGLVTGQTALLFILTIATANAWGINKYWDFESFSEQQYGLEKKTYLISTIMKFTLMTQLLMLLLLVISADELSRLLPGAMCATGTFGANAYGFPLFWLEVGCFFLFFVWLVMNQLDNKSPIYPLIKEKYSLLIAIYPLVGLKLILLVLFATNLSPGVITSCCGSVFSESSSSLGGAIAGISPKIILTVFSGIIFVLGILMLKETAKTLSKSKLFAWVEIIVWSAFFVVAVMTIISFMSTYIYQLPTHKCPFCLLKGEYYTIGIPIYLGLLMATGAGISKGTLRCYQNSQLLGGELVHFHKKLKYLALAGIILFITFGFGPFLLYYHQTGLLI